MSPFEAATSPPQRVRVRIRIFDEVFSTHIKHYDREQPMPTKDTVANFNPLLQHFTVARPKRLSLPRVESFNLA